MPRTAWSPPAIPRTSWSGRSLASSAQYESVAKILADQISVIPLYASPLIFVYKKALKGASKSNNPTNEGPTWNVEQWHW
jgi:hypothetical protein